MASVPPTPPAKRTNDDLLQELPETSPSEFLRELPGLALPLERNSSRFKPYDFILRCKVAASTSACLALFFCTSMPVVLGRAPIFSASSCTTNYSIFFFVWNSVQVGRISSLKSLHWDVLSKFLCVILHLYFQNVWCFKRILCILRKCQFPFGQLGVGTFRMFAVCKGIS